MSDRIVAQLRARRIEQRMPLKTLAYDLGVTEWWLCNIEHGRGKVRPAQLERWADLLGVSLALTSADRNDASMRDPSAPAHSQHV
jgi:transcriptional regulator with XRE-family HTH domain